MLVDFVCSKITFLVERACAAGMGAAEGLVFSQLGTSEDRDVRPLKGKNHKH